ncbi:hypothetical protein SLS64_004177 [Diaporthe eres]|uniref:Uncharacterized protein n=1 Tax=Diaporthe eres TaxID=83184 RepID=A0ABR1PL62_DIAER
MSSDTPNSNNNNNPSSSYNQKPPSPPPADMQHNRRGSVTSAAFANLFQRTNSATAGTPVFPGAITSAAINEQRRRLSLSTTSLGLSGTSPTGNPAFNRRASLSTNNSDSVDENAIEEEDYSSTSRTAPGFNWSEQLRSRAESTVASGQRPSFSFASGMTGSPPRTGATPKPRSPPRDTRPKPDAFQERILKGDFYMD